MQVPQDDHSPQQRTHNCPGYRNYQCPLSHYCQLFNIASLLFLTPLELPHASSNCCRSPTLSRNRSTMFRLKCGSTITAKKATRPAGQSEGSKPTILPTLNVGRKQEPREWSQLVLLSTVQITHANPFLFSSRALVPHRRSQAPSKLNPRP
jgi:hypothetical protein